MTERPLAIFDLDGTLTRRDSFLPFLISFGCRHARYGSLVGLPFTVGAYACRLMADHAAKERLLVSFLKNVPLETIEEHATWFCRTWLPRNLHLVGFRLLRWHQTAGHRTLLLSASPDVYVRRIARTLGIEEVVCTRTQTRDALCLGTLDGSNCKGLQKLEMLQAHLKSATAPRHSYAYGDSRHDQPVLEWVRHGHLIRRNAHIPLRRRDQARKGNLDLPPVEVNSSCL